MTGSGELHLHLDPLGGAAGDMFVAAMVRTFPDLMSRVLADVAAVLPAGVGQAAFGETRSAGIAAGRFELSLAPGGMAARHGPETTYAAMRDLIAGADLSDGTARHANAILHRIAEAEAKVHDIPIERVHFHELADWDSLMDVTAAGSVIAALAGASWSVGALPLGGGRVRTAHGLLPVPAPATAEILKGYDWFDDGVGGERITPTGAAIIAHLTEGKGNGRNPGGRLVATGEGAGTRAIEGMANILAIRAFEPAEGPATTDQVLQLAFDCDDMTGEEIGWATGRLRNMTGVRDVVLLTGQGKKGRPVFRVEILAAPEIEGEVAAGIFDLTSTLGIRRALLTRHVLPRTTDGRSIKTAKRPSGQTAKVESDTLADAPTLAERRSRAWAGIPD